MTDAPLLEFDESREAVLEASKNITPHPEMPEKVVFCFFNDVIVQWLDAGRITVFSKQLGSEMGINPIFVVEHQGQRIALMNPGVGAPLAIGFMEEVIALGGRQFVACGGAGALDKRVKLGHVVVPQQAIRDEGTSYHYLPASRTVSAHPDAVQAIVDALEAHSVPYDIGTTWTTDAIYRETPAKIEKRRAEGALTVEMEASAFFAVAQFRNVVFGQLLYGGDDVSGDVWDSRGWYQATTIREKMLELALDAIIRL